MFFSKPQNQNNEEIKQLLKAMESRIDLLEQSIKNLRGVVNRKLYNEQEEPKNLNTLPASPFGMTQFGGINR